MYDQVGFFFETIETGILFSKGNNVRLYETQRIIEIIQDYF